MDDTISMRGRSLTALVDKISVPDERWRIRGSGVTKWPSLCLQTRAVEQACHALGISWLSKSSGSPANADSYTVEATFLDGGIRGETGNYFFRPRGVWIFGSRALLLIALTLRMKVPTSWRQRYRLEEETVESLTRRLVRAEI